MSNEQRTQRMEKLETLRSHGVAPYPEKFTINFDLSEAGQLEDGTSGVRVAGRIMGIRKFSKFAFMT
ncbi:hypothetical protein ACTWQL_12220 [Pseudalkalibacillus sp. R45]|uniref:hypothetical protein n=1 Tax=Pseudalkalibacillus sp. R45 TaxID=3457433 RepID=UPI003FCEC50B